MANKFSEAATSYAINSRRITAGKNTATRVVTNRFHKAVQDHAQATNLLNQDHLTHKQNRADRLQVLRSAFHDRTAGVLNAEALAQLRAHSLISAPTFTSIYSGFEHARASDADRQQLRLEAQEKAAGEFDTIQDAKLAAELEERKALLTIQAQTAATDKAAIDAAAKTEQTIATKALDADNKDTQAQANIDKAKLLADAKAKLPADAKATGSGDTSVSGFFGSGNTTATATPTAGGQQPTNLGGHTIGGAGIVSLDNEAYTPYQLRVERNILRQLRIAEGGSKGNLATNLGNNEANAPTIPQGATIADVQAMQADGQFKAAGAFQIIPATLNALVTKYDIDPTLDFTSPEVQDDLARLLIREKSGLMNAIENEDKATTQNKLHEIWRAVPTEVDGVQQIADVGTDRQLSGARADNFYESLFDGIGADKALFMESEDTAPTPTPDGEVVDTAALTIIDGDDNVGLDGSRLGTEVTDPVTGIKVFVRGDHINPLTGALETIRTVAGTTDVDSHLGQQVIDLAVRGLYTDAASRGVTLVASDNGNIEVPIGEVNNPEALENYGITAEAVTSAVARHNDIADSMALTASDTITLSNGDIISTENLRLAKQIRGQITEGVDISEVQSDDLWFDGRTPTDAEAQAVRTLMQDDHANGVISFVTTSGEKTTISQEEANGLIPDGTMRTIEISTRQAEAKRIADEAEAEAKRIADEAEAEAKRLADEEEEE